MKLWGSLWVFVIRGSGSSEARSHVKHLFGKALFIKHVRHHGCHSNHHLWNTLGKVKSTSAPTTFQTPLTFDLFVCFLFVCLFPSRVTELVEWGQQRKNSWVTSVHHQHHFHTFHRWSCLPLSVLPLDELLWRQTMFSSYFASLNVYSGVKPNVIVFVLDIFQWIHVFVVFSLRTSSSSFPLSVSGTLMSVHLTDRLSLLVVLQYVSNQTHTFN